MIRLVNISKYYHDENSVVLGLRKINAEFNIGEFVAITGESGSGKSTLLNVISGVDTYEDGEMYINGTETSFYTSEDWEEYRKNNVGFIFQNYNLIDSYSVLENVESAMIIQGIRHEERVQRAKKILERVGLLSYYKQKATKLSGGQKQRLAIARALAKETSIIVADEPTGNLDSKTGKDIIELLHEISKEKLVVIVTHNYEEVSKYVTRKIRLFDGEIIEDREISKYDEVQNKGVSTEVGKMSFIQKSFSFAMLNLKGQPKRTILLFLVTFAMTFFVALFIASYDYSEIFFEGGKTNSVFTNNYENRLVVTKKDRTEFDNNDYSNLSKLQNINSMIRYDVFLDMNILIYDNIYLQGYANTLDALSEKDIIKGTYPKNKDEIVICGEISDNTFDNVVNKYIEIQIEEINYKLKVTGLTNVKYGVGESEFFFTNEFFEEVYANISLYKLIEDINLNIYSYGELFFSKINNAIFPNVYGVKKLDTLSNNTIVLTCDMNNIDNISAELYGKTINVVLEDYNLKDNKREGILYVSADIFNAYKEERITQVTLNMEKPKYLDSIRKDLDELGYYSTSPFSTSSDSMYLIRVIGTIFFLIAFGINILLIYLVGYLVIKTILLSKKKDYTIMRCIGIDSKTIKTMSKIEILTCFMISYVLVAIIIILVKNLTTNTIIIGILSMFNAFSICLIGLVNIILSLLVSRKYNKLLMKKSLLTNMKVE